MNRQRNGRHAKPNLWNIDCCFLCLKSVWTSGPNSGLFVGTRQSLQQLCQVLKVDIVQLTSDKFPDVAQRTGMGFIKDMDIEVWLCRHCNNHSERIKSLVQELEKVKMELDTCFEKINQDMSNSLSNSARLQQYRNKTSVDFIQSILANFMDGLRQEILTKSSTTRLSKRLPQLSLQPLEYPLQRFNQLNPSSSPFIDVVNASDDEESREDYYYRTVVKPSISPLSSVAGSYVSSVAPSERNMLPPPRPPSTRRLSSRRTPSESSVEQNKVPKSTVIVLKKNNNNHYFRTVNDASQASGSSTILEPLGDWSSSIIEPRTFSPSVSDMEPNGTPARENEDAEMGTPQLPNETNERSNNETVVKKNTRFSYNESTGKYCCNYPNCNRQIKRLSFIQRHYIKFHSGEKDPFKKRKLKKLFSRQKRSGNPMVMKWKTRKPKKNQNQEVAHPNQAETLMQVENGSGEEVGQATESTYSEFPTLKISNVIGQSDLFSALTLSESARVKKKPKRYDDYDANAETNGVGAASGNET